MATNPALCQVNKSVYRIPKKNSASKVPYLEECEVGGREGREIKAFVTQSVLDHNNMEKLVFSKIYLVHNRELSNSFHGKRCEMKSQGRRGRELDVELGFLVVKNKAMMESIYQKGLYVHHCDIKALGDPSQGVYLTRHVDICLRDSVQQYLFTTVLVFKVLLGKVKTLTPRTQYDQLIEPSSNYDCHLLHRVPDLSESQCLQNAFSLAYLYEFDNVMLPVKRPRQCLPYAVIDLKISKVAKARPCAPLTFSWIPATVPDHTRVLCNIVRGKREPQAQNEINIVSRDPQQLQSISVRQISVDTESPHVGTNPNHNCLNTQSQIALSSIESMVTDLSRMSSSPQATFFSASDHKSSKRSFSPDDITSDEVHTNVENIVKRSPNKFGSFEIPQSELNEPASENNTNAIHSRQSAASQFYNQSRGASNLADLCADDFDECEWNEELLNDNSSYQRTESLLSQPSSPPKPDIRDQVPSYQLDFCEDLAPYTPEPYVWCDKLLNDNSSYQHIESTLSQPSSPPKPDIRDQVPSYQLDFCDDLAPYTPEPYVRCDESYLNAEICEVAMEVEEDHEYGNNVNVQSESDVIKLTRTLTPSIDSVDVSYENVITIPASESDQIGRIESLASEMDKEVKKYLSDGEIESSFEERNTNKSNMEKDIENTNGSARSTNSTNVHHANALPRIYMSDIRLGYGPKKEYILNLSNVLLNATTQTNVLELNQMLDSCESLLPLFVGDLQESLGEPLWNVFVSAPLLHRFGLRETYPSVLLEGMVLEKYVELQMLLETTHYIQNRLNFLKGRPRFRTLLWYDQSLGMELSKQTFTGTLVNRCELSMSKEQVRTARVRLRRCAENHYVRLKYNAESSENGDLMTQQRNCPILPHSPQSGMVNLGDSVGDLEAQRMCTQQLLGKLFYAPVTDRSVEKNEHLIIILNAINRKQRWLINNRHTTLDPKQVSKFGMEHLEWNAAKLLVCQELEAKEPFNKKHPRELFSEVTERVRKMTVDGGGPDVRGAIEDTEDWHKLVQSFTFPRTISRSITTPRSGNTGVHCSLVALPGNERNTAEAFWSGSGNKIEQVTFHQQTHSPTRPNGSHRHREKNNANDYPADLPAKKNRSIFDSDIHGVGLHPSSSGVALLEEQPCVKTGKAQHAVLETNGCLQDSKSQSLVLHADDVRLPLLRQQEGEQHEKNNAKIPRNIVHTTVDLADMQFAPNEPGCDGEDCSTQIQEHQGGPQPISTESSVKSLFEVWDEPEWFPARCRQTMKN